MSDQTKSAIWAWIVTFAAGLLTVLTQVMTNGGGVLDIDPLAVLIAAIAALVSVDKDHRSQQSYPHTHEPPSVPRHVSADEPPKDHV